MSHVWRVIENSYLCTTYKSSVSVGPAKQNVPILLIECYNGSLAIWTIVSLTAAKLKPFIFSVLSLGRYSSLADSGHGVKEVNIFCALWLLFYATNLFILMILYDFCSAIQHIAAGTRQHSRSWYQAPSGPMTIFLFFPDFACFEMGLLFRDKRVWLL
jgi:hypothetical protein